MDLLVSHTGNSSYHVKSLTNTVCTPGSLCTRPQDIMVSFDGASFFIRVPIIETTNLLRWHFENILRLFCHVPMTSYVSCTGQFYEQIERIAMYSPLSPVTANFFKEDFNEIVLDWPAHKPLCWFCYVVRLSSSGHTDLTDHWTSLTTWRLSTRTIGSWDWVRWEPFFPWY
jgi:hypothetical protein